MARKLVRGQLEKTVPGRLDTDGTGVAEWAMRWILADRVYGERLSANSLI